MYFSIISNILHKIVEWWLLGKEDFLSEWRLFSLEINLTMYEYMFW